MGQYFVSVIGNESGAEKNVITLKFNDGEFSLGKLMEHAWWDDEYPNFISLQLTKKPFRVIWVGDYAKEQKLYDSLKDHSTAFEFPNYASVWGNNGNLYNRVPAEHNDFSLDKKYLVNHDKREYLDCTEYFNTSKSTIFKENDYVIHPLPLLTAIGNGLGMGDFDYHAYYGKEFVGIWAWDLLSIEDSSPQGYVLKDYKFIERNKYFKG